jgi:hypothetical protein
MEILPSKKGELQSSYGGESSIFGIALKLKEMQREKENMGVSLSKET